MKKQQIDFDFEKFGQKDVTAFIDGVEIATMHKFPVGYPDRYYGIDVQGMTYDRHKSRIKMYEEIKPREIWVNKYKHKLGERCYTTLEKAIEGSAGGCIGQVKFREVLDDEQ